MKNNLTKPQLLELSEYLLESLESSSQKQVIYDWFQNNKSFKNEKDYELSLSEVIPRVALKVS